MQCVRAEHLVCDTSLPYNNVCATLERGDNIVQQSFPWVQDEQSLAFDDYEKVLREVCLVFCMV